MVRGILTQHVMESVSKEMFGGEQGRKIVDQTLPKIEQSTSMPADQKRALVDMLNSVQKFYNRPSESGTSAATERRGITMPYTVKEEAMTAGSNIAYNGYAHSFAGMAIQFLLFAMANAGIEMLLERQRGLWKRLRSAPVSRLTLLAGRAAARRRASPADRRPSGWTPAFRSAPASARAASSTMRAEAASARPASSPARRRTPRG